MTKRFRLCGIVLVLAAVLSGPLRGAEATSDDAATPRDDPTGLSLDELMNVEVTSASRKPEALADTAAAVFVFSRDDIRRSGAQSLPDVLRMAPGVEVAQANDNDWYVSIRGFNEEAENKLLVLIDGRSVYSPVFSGVLWYEHDFLLEDIERIEIVRGPGATVWGANAVNGVINIITRHARDRQGGLVTVSGGTFDRLTAAARLGAPRGKHGYVAVWAKAFGVDQYDKDRNADLALEPDGWESLLIGARYDWDPPTPDAFSLQVGWHGMEADDGFSRFTLAPPYQEVVPFLREANTCYAQATYSHRHSERVGSSVTAFYDRNDNDWGNAQLLYETFDLDSQHHFPIGERHDVMIGLGFRRVADDLRTPDWGTTFFNPPSADRDLFSSFLEDEISIVHDRLRVKIGCKFEHNEFSGWEAQPNVRIYTRPWEAHVLWAAVSRAVRTPARLDADSSGGVTMLPSEFPAALNPDGLFGRIEIEEGDIDAESLVAYELGYRLRGVRRLWFDTAIFFNDYDEVRTYRDLSGGFQVTGDPPRLEWRLALDNGKHGHTYGADGSLTWQVRPNWTLHAAYSFLEMDLDLENGYVDLQPITGVEGKSPRRQFSLRSQWDVRDNLECDLWVRHVDELTATGADAYTTFDARVAWMPREGLELSLVGRNLAEEWHNEFRAYEVERSVYGKISVLF